ncbi:zinc finger, CCHC-type, retrotransposon gag domain protein [Tanacetum coccineum]
MVKTTRTNAELASGRSRHAGGCMLPQIRGRFAEEYRAGALGRVYVQRVTRWLGGKAISMDKGGDAVGPYFDLGSFQSTISIRKGASGKIVCVMQRFLRLAGFLGQAAGTAEEQAKNFRWGLHKSILDHVMCIQFTDVAQTKRHKNHVVLWRTVFTLTVSWVAHWVMVRVMSNKNDRQGSDRQGGGGNYRNNNNNNHSRDNNRNSGAGRDQRNRGQQSHRSTNSGSQQSRVPSEGYTHPVCNTCGRRHPGECRRAVGTCFKCGQAGHLQRDCKKNFGASSSGM